MTQPDKHDHAITRPGNRSGVVFVHGILGHYTQSWGKFPSLLNDDSGLVHYNVHFWGYPSSPAFFYIPFIGKKPPTIAQVAEAFVTYLEFGVLAEYVDLVLIGHSMGGLVIRQALLHALASQKKHRELLDKIRHVLLFASPSTGVDLNGIFRVHPQARQLAATSDFMTGLQAEWSKSVYTGDDEQPPEGKTAYPVTAVVGLQDAAVTEESAKAHYETVKTIPGNHISMCKPESANDPSFTIVRQELLKAAPAPLIVGKADIVQRTQKIVRDARRLLFITGSRSHNTAYLQEIETKLAQRPSLEYRRVLLGPPTKEMYDHVVKVIQTRPPADRVDGEQVTFIHLFEDFELQPEVFLCGNERCCIAILPPMTSLGEYSTGYYFTATQHVDDYLRLTKELATKGRELTKLEDVPAPRPG